MTHFFSSTIIILFLVPFLVLIYVLMIFGMEFIKPLQVQSQSSNNLGYIDKSDCNLFTFGVLEESDSPKNSKEKCWWLDSGAMFFVENGVGKTLEKNISIDSAWFRAYAKNNPIDTDNGTHPQNLFRLINTEKWTDVSETVLFQIKKYNQSRSPNRNSSNGVFLMNHYIDADNLYYGGVRVDNMVIIKKKINGVYTTLATAFFDDTISNRIGSNFLLPTNKWIGLKFISKNNEDGRIELQLFVDRNGSEDWRLLLDVIDSKELSGSDPIVSSGNTGIRSDFMDIEFRNFANASP